MNTSAHNNPEYWREELARINARLDEFELRFEAECHVLRGAVDIQIEQLRGAIQRMENDMAAGGSDAYVQRVAAQIAELKRKGDVAYDLLQENLRQSNSSTNTASRQSPRPKLRHRQIPRDASARTQADS